MCSPSQSDECEGVGGGSEGERGKYPCGECGREVKDNDEAIYCESGCEQWYHRWVWPNHVTHRKMSLVKEKEHMFVV